MVEESERKALVACDGWVLIVIVIVIVVAGQSRSHVVSLRRRPFPVDPVPFQPY